MVERGEMDFSVGKHRTIGKSRLNSGCTIVFGLDYGMRRNRFQDRTV